MKRISDFCRFLALAGVAGMLLTVLAGCGTLPQSAGESVSSSTAESTASTQETAATEEVTSPEESLPDPDGAAAFTYEQCQAAALRAQEYWSADMITGPAIYRYAVAENVAASVVSYETCIYNERLLTLTSFGEEGERHWTVSTPEPIYWWKSTFMWNMSRKSIIRGHSTGMA